MPLTSVLSQRSGWSAVFVAAAVLNFAAAALALLGLKPARVRAFNRTLIPDAMGITRV